MGERAGSGRNDSRQIPPQEELVAVWEAARAFIADTVVERVDTRNGSALIRVGPSKAQALAMAVGKALGYVE